MALVNGRQYSYADITVVMGGRDVIALRGIKYTSKQEKEVLYGKGNKPLSIQKGNISYEGEITVLQSELETLMLLSDEEWAMRYRELEYIRKKETEAIKD